MAIYSYKGIDGQNGKQVKGNITSDSLAMAKQKIGGMGILLLEISEKKSKDSSNKLGGITLGKGVNVENLALMTRQLATLISAKIPLSEALAALIDQVDHPYMKIVLSEVRQKINEGLSLAKGLSEYPKVFDTIYVNMVEAGEASGTLELVLLRLAEFTENRTRLKNKIKSAMMYPVFMGGFGLLMMLFIFVKIIPTIAKIFVSMKKELPLPTRICLAISEFLQHYWYVLLIVVPLLINFVRVYLRSKNGEARWHRLQLKIPILGQIITMINVGRFCSTLSTLLSSGVPILTALKIVKNLISNVHMQNSVSEAQLSVAEGASMATPLMNSGYFPPLVTHMIKLGEKSGELESLLDIVAKSYNDQVNNKLDGLTSILEPIMMVVLGGLVALVVMSVVVPMINLNTLKH